MYTAIFIPTNHDAWKYKLYFFSSTKIEEALDEEIEISQIGLLEIFIPIRFSLDAQLIPASSLNPTIYSQVLLPDWYERK